MKALNKKEKMAEIITGKISESEERKSSIETRVRRWLKDPCNLALALLAVFVIILYLYYFFKLGTQPIWWDEGDYLSIGKELAFNRERPEWWAGFLKIRPLVLPIIFAVFFKLGIEELPVRFFTELLPALASIFLIYIISKEIFNKKIGIIAAFLISVNWVFMFYTFRLLTDIPSLLFAALSLYFFWVKYEKPILKGMNEKPVYLWLSIAFGVLAFLTRYVTALTLIVIVAYMIITRRFSLLKNKNIWIALVIALLCFTPYFAYNYITKGAENTGIYKIFPALRWYHGDEATAPHRAFAWNTLTFHLPNFFKSFSLIFFTIGSLVLLELFLYLDIVLKQKDKSKNNLLFCFLGILIPLGYFIFGIRAVDARYFIATAPLMFAAAGLGIDFVSRKISKIFNIKYLYLLIILAIIFAIGYQQLKTSNEFIVSRMTSYQEIRDGGLWLKENTSSDATIITASVTQNQYYSERQSYSHNTNDTIFAACTVQDENLITSLSTNESCQRETESAFNRKVMRIGADYYVLSVFEPVFTPQWAYSYPERYNLTMVKAYAQGNQPILVIYKYPENFNAFEQ